MQTASSPAAASCVLFLDFDGVLQTPALPHWREMELADRLEKLLDQLPDLRVVVSSTHREGRTVADMNYVLPPRVAHRVIGLTPLLPMGRSNGGRQLEIESWLLAHPKVTAWAAVDDEEWLYRPDCPWLVTTHPLVGWNPETTTQLCTLLHPRSVTQQGRGFALRPMR